MSFVISKKSSWHGQETKLYYLVQNYRVGNKIKRKTLMKLGQNPNLQAALANIQEKIKESSARLEKTKRELELAKAGKYVLPFGLPYRTVQRLTESLEWIATDLKKLQEEQIEIEKFMRV